MELSFMLSLGSLYSSIDFEHSMVLSFAMERAAAFLASAFPFKNRLRAKDVLAVVEVFINESFPLVC